MQDPFAVVVPSLWFVGLVAFLFLAHYHGRRIWKYGGSRFLAASDAPTKLIFIGTALCLLSIPFAAVASGGLGWFYFVSGSIVSVVGLLVLCPLSVATWRRTLDRPARGGGVALESDGPLNNPQHATVKLRGVVRRVSSLLCNADTSVPLTVGVTGRWGSGKSSLMNMVKLNISDAGFPCVWFNAWHHQRETHLFAALMEAIHSEVEQWSFERYVSFRLNLVRARIAQAPVRFLGFSATLLALVLGVWMAFMFFHENNYYGGIAFGLVSSLLATYPVAKGYKFFGKVFGVAPAVLASGVAAQFKLARFRERLGFRHEFGTAFRQACQALGNRRLVIVIDDLDRCGPEQVVTILEAVNFLTSSGDCVILLGMDEDRVMEAVGCYFSAIGATGAEAKEDENDAQRYAKNYLEKLVGLWVPVPAVSSEDLRRVRG